MEEIEDSQGGNLNKKKPHNEAGLEALRWFAEQYSPATKDDADTFYTTKEIVAAIEDHTGIALTSKEVFELMSQMEFKYEALSGMQFNWLLKKD